MTMTALLEELRQRGITVASQGGNLKVQAPQGALTADLRARLTQHKEAMLNWLHEFQQTDEAALPVCVPDAAQRHEPFPLSDMQLGFYMADDPYMEFHVRPHYYIEKNIERFDVARYEAAWNKALLRHRGEIVTVQADGRLAVVKDPAPLRCVVQDLRSASLQEAKRAIEQTRAQMMRSELPLDRWPWVDLRATLWKENGVEKATVHYNHNNFFSDGFGTTKLLQEIDVYYDNPNAEFPQFPPLTLSFRDAALTLDALAQSPAGQAAQHYWEQRLDALPGPPPLPVQAHMDRRCRSKLERREGWIPAKVWAALKARATHFGLTPSSAVFGAYAEIVSAWSNSRHFVLSNMMTRRLNIHPEMRSIVGNFASLYPLEIDFRGAESFVERARRLQEQVIRDAKHLQWGGMQVMQALNRRKGSLGNAAIPFVIGSGLFMEGFERSDFSCLETSQVMLDHQFWELTDGRFYYVWDLLEPFFPPGMIDSMWNTYRHLLARLAEDDALWQKQVIDLTPVEMLTARAALYPPEAPVPPQMLHDFLQDATLAFPESPALMMAEQTLTYRELDWASDSIASALTRTAPVQRKPVAIVAHRGAALFKAVYGVFKAGAAYVPIDPSLPDERRNTILANCAAAAVLAERQCAESLQWPDGMPVITIEDAETGNLPYDGLVDGHPSDLAYLIYTSGSTGQPKGVMIEHRGVVNTLLDINRRFQVNANDRLFGVSSFGFDLSVYDLFGGVAAGAALVYPDPEQSLNPSHWLDAVQEHGVTIWNSAPPLALLLTETAESRGVTLPHMRLVMLSGDWIPVDLPDRIRRIAPHAQVVSLGGATEASIWSILYEIGTVDPAWPSIPYGFPMQNQPWYILDEWGRAAPDWTAGELYIGGIGLARGYWGDEEKTAASFVQHPKTGERIYRTGDIGRYLPDGAIEFLGRKDAQVKIQGHRIELGEIESVLSADPRISAAVAAVQTFTTGAQLVAYVVPAANAKISSDVSPDILQELRATLAKKLPDYMVPRTIQVIECLPLSSNGKVDRKALPRIEEEQAKPQIRNTRSPANETESRMLAIWRKVLNQPELCVTDDFFDMGGQSFEAVRIIGAVREAFGVSLSLGAIWQERTVERVTAQLQAASSTSHLVMLRKQGAHRRLFLVHPAGGHVMCYRHLAGLLDRPVWAFQAPGVDGHEKPLTSIAALAAVYVDLLEQAQPEGPVFLGGWSSGALIAFEMAVQLRRRHRVVAGVAMIDCPAPSPSGPVDDKVLQGWFREDLGFDLQTGHLPADHLPADQLTAIYGVFAGIVRGSREYAGQPIDADVLLIRAEEGIVSEFAAYPHSAQADWGWRAYTSGDLATGTAAGTHYTLLSESSVAGLAKTLEGWLLSREK